MLFARDGPILYTSRGGSHITDAQYQKIAVWSVMEAQPKGKIVGCEARSIG